MVEIYLHVVLKNKFNFRGAIEDGLSWEYKYQTNYDESSGDKNGCQTSSQIEEALLRFC